MDTVQPTGTTVQPSGTTVQPPGTFVVSDLTNNNDAKPDDQDYIIKNILQKKDILELETTTIKLLSTAFNLVQNDLEEEVNLLEKQRFDDLKSLFNNPKNDKNYQKKLSKAGKLCGKLVLSCINKKKIFADFATKTKPGLKQEEKQYIIQKTKDLRESEKGIEFFDKAGIPTELHYYFIEAAKYICKYIVRDNSFLRHFKRKQHARGNTTRNNVGMTDPHVGFTLLLLYARDKENQSKKTKQTRNK